MLLAAIDRLEHIIDTETEALLARSPIDRDDINRRKSQSLLELTRLVRALPQDTTGPALESRLRRLREKLDLNQSTLDMHVKAVQEVAEVISSAIRHADSDGTYSSHVSGLGVWR